MTGCPLSKEGYDFVFGQGATSWALCFDLQEETLSAMHDMRARALPDFHMVSDPWVRLRRRGGDTLLALLPGEDEERVIFTDLPKDTGLFCVASTVWGQGKLIISEGEECPAPEPANAGHASDSGSEPEEGRDAAAEEWSD